jgi:hypothetical protein
MVSAFQSTLFVLPLTTSELAQLATKDIISNLVSVLLQFKVDQLTSAAADGIGITKDVSLVQQDGFSEPTVSAFLLIMLVHLSIQPADSVLPAIKDMLSATVFAFLPKIMDQLT